MGVIETVGIVFGIFIFGLLLAFCWFKKWEWKNSRREERCRQVVNQHLRELGYNSTQRSEPLYRVYQTQRINPPLYTRSSRQQTRTNSPRQNISFNTQPRENRRQSQEQLTTAAVNTSQMSEPQISLASASSYYLPNDINRTNISGHYSEENSNSVNTNSERSIDISPVSSCQTYGYVRDNFTCTEERSEQNTGYSYRKDSAGMPPNYDEVMKSTFKYGVKEDANMKMTQS